MNESEKYLGNPIHFKRHKIFCFDDSLMSKIKKNIQSWQATALSQAGRNIQVKSIVSPLSVYNMTVLQLPKQTLNSMDKMMRKFWWDDSVDKNKFHTIKWSELCKPIEEGAPGIRKIQ